MEVKTYSKNLRISPKKLRFLLPEIKKLSPAEAIVYLFYTPNRSAKIFYKSIKSAITNAKNVLKIDDKMLRFKHLSVEEGHKLKRFRPGGRGTAKPILKRFAHIKIIIEAEEPKKPEILNPKPEIPNKSKIAKSKTKKV
ncbi:hypothetical protein A2954_05715 [Candidatus Roizmanbacteria bacterium RIFCSPLOWO2_01_FULL_37_12]|uniref:Large ribosomal subunit protein uL22 n=1 Tax=Candidatus Roizmanbacteria bacterium RIFCSPLOWO2_01_FULL_37_12 TaxID=1802056 RepID=A0A1F7IBR5_9BACT|nr:MAG: hypothetical protein A2768_02455 [Candidatus Roizmanbacteria bacterium RIFCSPHIGHO2_01_FULL_37_16]OGK25970.1 MAG: hypothetical protein A3D76_03330 [Candidatus Roizmanbacteria bacterium RIFCSPHIGHO2_02_FULL_37_9b]OGK40805.1 MAG: hypothetical protein A2954_05715 [Candidatus Roizmanbacteria bacterium RIFCSPLOWO2_01_FULL_37_12]